MTKRFECWVAACTAVAALAGLGCLTGWPQPEVKEKAIEYQEVAVIQLAERFVPSEIVLVKGRPARLHITNAFAKPGTHFTIDTLGTNAELQHAELTQVILTVDQLEYLDERKFTCAQTGNTGVFRVVEGAEPIQPKAAGGVVELAVVMTDTLAAPRSITIRKNVPVKLYVTKTKGVEEDDTFLLDAWGIREDVEVGMVTEIELTPPKPGDVTYMAIITPSSRGTIHVVD